MDQQTPSKTFELKHLEQLDPREITEDDLRRMIELLELDYQGKTVKDVLALAAQGLVQIWRAKDGPEGLIITQVLRHNTGKELVIWGLIGKGLFRYTKGLRQDLEEIVRQADARWLSGYTYDPRLQRIYERIGRGDGFYRYQYLEDMSDERRR
jgi:hypothetical protein